MTTPAVGIKLFRKMSLYRSRCGALLVVFRKISKNEGRKTASGIAAR